VDNFVLVLILALIGFMLWSIYNAVRDRTPDTIEMKEEIEAVFDEYGNVNDYYFYTDEHGIRHGREGNYPILDRQFFEDVEYPVFQEAEFTIMREIKIGQSDLFFYVNEALDRFAIGLPEYPATVHIYEVSKIRRFEIDEEDDLLYIYMDDIYEPVIQLQFIGNQKIQSLKDHKEALASAREVASVLEFILEGAANTDHNATIE
jgi:hypothetical protein